MKKIETYQIDFGAKRLPFRFSIMSFIKFQDDYHKEITEIKTVGDSVNYFYCAYYAGCLHDKKQIELELSDFVGLLDDYPQAIQALTEKLLESSGTKKK